MRSFLLAGLFSILAAVGFPAGWNANTAANHFYPADDPRFQFTGRIDFSNPQHPRFWAPGVCIRAAFKGTDCTLIVQDEVLYGSSHNYIEIVVDHQAPVRIQTKSRSDTIVVARDLDDGIHVLTICKDTESGIGWLSFSGLICRELAALPPKDSRKMEFIGNSITCGSGMDVSEIPCGKGKWYDQHNAYESYGAITARSLHAQWVLSSVSGIGLIHSCCDMSITMPPVFDKVNMRADSVLWDFRLYQPDVVTICLGQNDGLRDSIIFCTTYIKFITKIRSVYPSAKIICLSSPMGDEQLTAALKNYLSGITRAINEGGDKNVSCYFFSKRYHNGCGGHPDWQEHQQIAKELTGYISHLMNWN